MILPPGHWQTVAAPRRLRVREKWMIASVLGFLAATAIALVISLASGGRTTGNGCVDVTVQYFTGGTEIYRCGAQARSLCGSVNSSGYAGAVGRAVATECRKAGLPASR